MRPRGRALPARAVAPYSRACRPERVRIRCARPSRRPSTGRWCRRSTPYAWSATATPSQPAVSSALDSPKRSRSHSRSSTSRPMRRSCRRSASRATW